MGTFVAGCSRKPVSAMFLAFALTKDLLALNPILVACLANRADCGCASVVHRSERATTPPLRPLRPLLELGARRDRSCWSCWNSSEFCSGPAREESRAHWSSVVGSVLTTNPEPLAPVFDAVLLGDGDELLPEFINAVQASRSMPRGERLRALAQLTGVYVPQPVPGLLWRR